MNFYDVSREKTLSTLNSNAISGLSLSALKKNSQRFGYNELSEKKKKGIFSRVADAVKEPMLLILLFGFFITFGVNLGKFLKSGEGDFVECFGILSAVILSVAITVIMESSSQKAFQTLNKIYENLTVKVIRDGEIIIVDKKFITIGDVILLENGDKVVADGRLIESVDLLIDESALTGESVPTKKESLSVLTVGTPLAERRNMVYSGTFVTAGFGKMVVTSIGDNTEIGKIADQISSFRQGNSPLQQKLAKLGKSVTLLGAGCAVFILIISLVRLGLIGGLTFSNVQDLVISCIILIVAAVPEGLPTIVAVSLALNMIKLASENALIKRMTATETAGAVSVICSDKTGTLTQNKMSVTEICTGEYCQKPEVISNYHLIMNFVCNNTAELVKEGKKLVNKGSGTECALLKVCIDNKNGYDYKRIRKDNPVIHTIPFTSERKCMFTSIKKDDFFVTYAKGAPERILDITSLSEMQKRRILKEIQNHQQKAERIICFAHIEKQAFAQSENDFYSEYVYDGFVALKDPCRPEVKKAVQDCKRAGIDVKILTGDNITTALAVARELGIAKHSGAVINASVIEKLNDKEVMAILPKISVIARSTPSIKLRVVKLLKMMGEVVAVTGDGINDAPAIKHADVGIAMGISGSDITKETADVVLLDDSFATVVKTISFGRNVYKNLQRFIIFQLSVNATALLYITACALMGLESPFNTLQLLWINVIMDGPPALTLGLEKGGKSLMNHKPVKRNASILSKYMILRIMLNGAFMSGVLIIQTLTNFMCAKSYEQPACLFTLFITMQLFNAFNSKEIGAESVFLGFWKNKIMVFTFLCVFLVHVLIVNFFPALFNVAPMRLITWLNCIIVSSFVLIVVELAKFVYRLLRRKRDNSLPFINKSRRGFDTSA